MVKFLSEAREKKDMGSLQILLNNANTNAIQAVERKEKEGICLNIVAIFVFKQDLIIGSKKKIDSKFSCLCT